jgi:hypothetical protein
MATATTVPSSLAVKKMMEECLQTVQLQIQNFLLKQLLSWEQAKPM